MLSSKNAKKSSSKDCLTILGLAELPLFLENSLFKLLKKILKSSKHFKCKTSIACLQVYRKKKLFQENARHVGLIRTSSALWSTLTPIFWGSPGS